MTLLAASGLAQGNLPLADRGLAYGDGLFETMAVVDGRVRLLGNHLHRLQAGLDRLEFKGLAAAELAGPLAAAAAAAMRLPDCAGAAALKLMVTRGEGPRGYTPPREPSPRWWIQAFPWRPPAADAPPARTLISTVRLAPQPLLAGLKHLNRLEQVLARQRLSPDVADEVLMLDHAGVLVCASAANLFVVRGGCLLTPALEQCGVAGVVRSALLAMAAAGKLRWPVVETRLLPDELEQADEVFLTSALRGIWPVESVDGRRIPVGGVAAALAQWWRELR